MCQPRGLTEKVSRLPHESSGEVSFDDCGDLGL